MAIPRVFVSSTYYDLRYVRENLKFFIRNAGFEPVLSEEGSVYFNPRVHVHASAVAEVPNCQLFVLIIGGRSGTSFMDGDKSITNREYEEAARAKIPIFALVEQEVLSQSQVYYNNKDSTKFDHSEISYPAVDNVKVFHFLDDVRGSAVNNALVPFHKYEDIERYLRKQWSGMMFNFLATEGERNRVADMLEQLQEVNAKIEFLSKQILESVGTKAAQVTARMYDRMMAFEAIRDLTYLNVRPTPQQVLTVPDYDDLAGGVLSAIDDEDRGYFISASGEISSARLSRNRQEYSRLRSELQRILAEEGVSLEDIGSPLDRMEDQRAASERDP